MLCFVLVFFILAVYFLLKGDKKSAVFGMVYLLGGIACIIVYEYSCSKNIKQILLAQKEAYNVDELCYDLIFENQSVKIMTQNTTGTLKYKDITMILKTEHGFILFFGYNVFIYCQTDYIDAQIKDELVSLLKKLPIKWIER